MALEEQLEVKNYFDVHFKILLFFGIPIHDINFKFKKLYIFYAILMHTFSSTLYPTSELLGILVNFNVDTFSFVITYFISHFLAFCKICLIFLFRTDISQFCKKLETGNFSPNPDRGGHIETVYIRNAITLSTRQSYFFHLFVVIIVGQRCLYAILSNPTEMIVFDEETQTNLTVLIRTKPFISYIPFNDENSPLHEIISIYQAASCMISGFIIGAADAIIYGFMCHIKAQFLILIHSLDTFIDRTERLMIKDGIEIDLGKFKCPPKLPNGICIVEKLPREAQKYANRCVNDIIEHHQEILDLAAGCEHIFSWLLLVQFAGSCLLICMQLYQLSIYSIVSIPFATMSCYLMLMSVQVVLFCWHGNELQLISEQISEVAFHSNWIVTDLSTQKSILMMITRSIRPIRMTAGKFIFLSLESFMSLMKGSGSYFMFLKEMNNET